jgi:hypothetical protein
VEHNHASRGLPDEDGLLCGKCLRDHRDDGVHEVRITHGPLHRLDAAHGRARNGDEVGETEALGEHPVFGTNHVADAEPGESHVEARARRRRRGAGVNGGDAKRVGLDHEILVGVESFSRSGPRCLTVARPSQTVDLQDSVAARGVQPAEGDIRHSEIRDGLTALELQCLERARLNRGLRPRDLSRQGHRYER